MSFKSAALTALVLTALPSIAIAQIGEPVVAPWSVEKTPTQSQIRQYQNFKRQQNEERLNAPAPDEYEYALDNRAMEARPSANAPRPITLKHPPIAATPSRIEDMYSNRIVEELSQFGYDLFGVPDETTQGALANAAKDAPSMPSGAVQDDFILSSGDELEIMFTGQRNDRATYKVNSQGQILIQDFPPIPAAGRSIGHVRISIEAAASQLHNTQAYVSLSAVKQIGVVVVGHVKRPGRQNLTVFHTVLDALMATGGVNKTGSLRQIKLVRGGRSTVIDLYGLLMHGSTNMDMALRDGDRIIIPPIGPTVAIAGEAKRTGIFEILPRVRGMYSQPEGNSEHLTLNEMLELAGGVLSPGKNRFLKLGVTSDGQEIVEDIAADNETAFTPAFGDGAILMVSKGAEKRAGMIELAGHSLRPGLHAIDKNKTLSDLFNSPDLLGADIYPLMAVIERWNEDQMSRTYLDFPLRLVLKKQGAVPDN